MFAYCDNNPVVRTDDDGDFWHIIAGTAVGAAFSIGWQMIVEHKTLKTMNWVDVGASAISGGLAASGLGTGWQMAFNAVLGGASSAASGGDVGDIGASAFLGLGSGFIGRRGANYRGAITKTVKQTKRTIAREARRANQKYAKKSIKNAKSFAKKTITKIGVNATSRYVAGYSAAKGGYYYYNNKRRGHAY